MLFCLFCARLCHLHCFQGTMLVQPACHLLAACLEEPTVGAWLLCICPNRGRATLPCSYVDGAFVPHGQLHAQPGGLLSIDSKQLALAQQGGNLTFGSGELNPYPAYTCMWHVQHQ